jgi:MoxR-like ATPase
LLLDEIDKAEPDLPNDLLEPLDRLRFQVPNGPEVRAPEGLKTLVVITTNGERELPQAFLRRCVSLVLAEPDQARLIEIARHHFPDKDQDTALFATVARRVLALREVARERGLRPPSTSEYLDALRACDQLGVDPDHPLWSRVERATLEKEAAGDTQPGAGW